MTYLSAGRMTEAGAHAPALAALPAELPALVGIVQGLLLHLYWADSYGVTLTEERREEPHLRGVEAMLDRLLALDGRPLATTRPPATRLVGVCRHFTVLLAAMLRAQGIAARARCGFATYFDRERSLDHWVCEYWRADARRWVLVDAQLDALQRERLRVDFDALNVPRDRFVVAGEAWRACRAGSADPGRFGILDQFGLWFVAGNVVRDLAALSDREMLPWDVWGAMPQPDEAIDAERLRLLDRVAVLTEAPDDHPAELRRAYADERLRVPASVFNAVRGRLEPV
ncbi:MAG: transglutaminase-like domain-containing protein [Geminicoccaceae bacterium]